jgi:hypothetical protein
MDLTTVILFAAVIYVCFQNYCFKKKIDYYYYYDVPNTTKNTNTTTLYSLSKDAHIHLISTIQEGWRDDLIKSRNITQNILDTIRLKSRGACADICCFEGCHRIYFSEEPRRHGDEWTHYYNDGSISCCQCTNCPCPQIHINDGCRKDKDLYTTCSDGCAKKGDNGEGWYCVDHVPDTYLITNRSDDYPLSDLRHFSFVCDKCIDHYEN